MNICSYICWPMYMYDFLIGIELNFSSENYTVKESDMSVQLSLILSKEINCCSVSVLLKCENFDATGKLFSFVLIFLTTFFLY